MGYNPAHYDRTKGSNRLAKEHKKRVDSQGRPCHTSDSSYWNGVSLSEGTKTMHPLDIHDFYKPQVFVDPPNRKRGMTIYP